MLEIVGRPEYDKTAQNIRLGSPQGASRASKCTPNKNRRRLEETGKVAQSAEGGTTTGPHTCRRRAWGAMLEHVLKKCAVKACTPTEEAEGGGSSSTWFFGCGARKPGTRKARGCKRGCVNANRALARRGESAWGKEKTRAGCGPESAKI